MARAGNVQTISASVAGKREVVRRACDTARRPVLVVIVSSPCPIYQAPGKENFFPRWAGSINTGSTKATRGSVEKTRRR
jgi:hypothetical protein